MRWYLSCCAYVRGGSSVFQIVSAIAIFVLKRDVKLQLTNSLFQIFTVTAGVRQDGYCYRYFLMSMLIVFYNVYNLLAWVVGLVHVITAVSCMQTILPSLHLYSLCELQRMIDRPVCVDEAANLCMQFVLLLWPPYVVRQAIICLPCGFYLPFFFFFFLFFLV